MATPSTTIEPSTTLEPSATTAAGPASSRASERLRIDRRRRGHLDRLTLRGILDADTVSELTDRVECSARQGADVVVVDAIDLESVDLEAACSLERLRRSPRGPAVMVLPGHAVVDTWRTLRLALSASDGPAVEPVASRLAL